MIQPALTGAIMQPDGTLIRGRGRRETLPAGPHRTTGSTSADPLAASNPLAPATRVATGLARGLDRLARLETGAQLPSEDDLRIWAQHIGASDEQTETLIDMMSAARVE
ncbi:MAG: hypothetical protein ACREX8_04440 [Gammaproteobacteria bacterium]